MKKANIHIGTLLFTNPITQQFSKSLKDVRLYYTLSSEVLGYTPGKDSYCSAPHHASAQGPLIGATIQRALHLSPI